MIVKEVILAQFRELDETMKACVNKLENYPKSLRRGTEYNLTVSHFLHFVLSTMQALEVSEVDVWPKVIDGEDNEPECPDPEDEDPEDNEMNKIRGARRLN